MSSIYTVYLSHSTCAQSPIFVQLCFEINTILSEKTEPRKGYVNSSLSHTYVYWKNWNSEYNNECSSKMK